MDISKLYKGSAGARIPPPPPPPNPPLNPLLVNSVLFVSVGRASYHVAGSAASLNVERTSFFKVSCCWNLKITIIWKRNWVGEKLQKSFEKRQNFTNISILIVTSVLPHLIKHFPFFLLTYVLVYLSHRGGSRIFSRQANFWKNSQKSHFWALFEKFWQKNRVIFGARSHSKLVYIGAKGAFRKILWSGGQKWISEKVSKGGNLSSA